MEILLNATILETWDFVDFARFDITIHLYTIHVLLHCRINIRDENMDEPILENRMMK